MNPRLAGRLAALYPRSWRQRYQGEFIDFLEAHPSDLKSILNVAGWALYERSLLWGGMPMDPRQNSFTWMILAGLAALAAGINYYGTVDDTPLALAMRTHQALSASWTIVQAGAVALLAVAILASRVLFSVVRAAFVNRRMDVICRLAVPLIAGVVTLAWLVSASILTHTRWVPTPWDVTGDWTAPADWPPLATRWALSSVTLILLMGGLVATAASLGEAVLRSDLSRQVSRWFVVPSLLLAGSVVVMEIGVLSWGWFVEQYAPAVFHARNGGIFSSTNFASWTASSVVMLAAAAMAIKSARSALSVDTESADGSLR